MYANSKSLGPTFRRAVTGAVMLGAMLAPGSAAFAQDQQLTPVAVTTTTTTPAQKPGQQMVTLSTHCDDIRDVFKLARFNGEYKARADAFVAGNCVGNAPIPRDGDRYNMKRWNTSAYILHTGGIELN